MENSTVEKIIWIFNTVILSIIAWAVLMASGVLYCMAVTPTGRTEALFGAVFFEAIDDTKARSVDVSLGFSSIPTAFFLFCVILIVVSLRSHLIRSKHNRKKGAEKT